MKKLIYTSLVSTGFLTHVWTMGCCQNLVPNGDFEILSSCPNGFNQLALASPWVKPTWGTSDYFNSCNVGTPCVLNWADVPDNYMGTEPARSGSGYAGCFMYENNNSNTLLYREYIQVQLTSSLTAGVAYDVVFYVSLAEDNASCGDDIFACNNIGAYISVAAPSSASFANLPFTPQVNYATVISGTTGWTPVTGTFTATGGENYITIGNFFDNAATTVTPIRDGASFMNAGYYYVDDVCVTPQGGTGCGLLGGVNVSIIPADASCNGKCDGSAQANATGGTAPYTYSWNTSPVQATQTATGLCAGTSYTVTVTDAVGGTATITTVVSQPPPIPITVTATPTIVTAGSTSQLTATGGGTYQWSPSTGLSCTTCSNPIATPTVTTTYSVTVTNASGCTATAFVPITVDIICGELFVPNAFSPNNDGTNELECIMGNCIEKLHFAIYDRWGEKVFETTNPNNVCWDGFHKGKLMNTAVFVYYLRATLTSGEKIKKEGNITLIR